MVKNTVREKSLFMMLKMKIVVMNGRKRICSLQDKIKTVLWMWTQRRSNTDACRRMHALGQQWRDIQQQ